ncbi:hypothetical protein TRVL_06089 [Trypanosoma vivax]|nr:hypothetical protein TRVL_06089 [Trypanosoma vivax]
MCLTTKNAAHDTSPRVSSTTACWCGGTPANPANYMQLFSVGNLIVTVPMKLQPVPRCASDGVQLEARFLHPIRTDHTAEARHRGCAVPSLCNGSLAVCEWQHHPQSEACTMACRHSNCITPAIRVYNVTDACAPILPGSLWQPSVGPRVCSRPVVFAPLWRGACRINAESKRPACHVNAALQQCTAAAFANTAFSAAKTGAGTCQ